MWAGTIIVLTVLGGVAFVGMVVHELSDFEEARVMVTLPSLLLWAPVAYGALGVEHYPDGTSSAVVETELTLVLVAGGFATISLIELVFAIASRIGDEAREARRETSDGAAPRRGRV